MYSQQSLPGRGRRGGRPLYSSRNHRVKQPKSVDASRFVNQAVEPEQEAPFEPVHKFNDFGFDVRLARNVADKGYTLPTPVQDGVIPAAMAGNDILGLANTGTGKTAAFLLPLMHRLLRREVRRVLVLAPTRELAVQIDDEFKQFARGLNLYSARVVGGVGVGGQLMALKRRPQVIIATPGRLKDLLENYGMQVADVDALVLDEADRMLDMGFIRDIRAIIKLVPQERQTLFLSATTTPEVQGLIGQMLQDPVTVSVRKGETSDHVEQDVVEVEGRDAKDAKLAELLQDPAFTKVLVFGETKFGVQKLADRLAKQGLKVAAIHGNKSQGQRQRALEDFRREKVQALIATDVAARGLDIPNVSHVINYDVPKTYEDYVHRIGRTGRAGARGQALTFVPAGRQGATR